ncbi:MAG TPA: right-handed parallel beta-helix repeat-containing protein [Planctomycetota bacterium]|nr:right-handed parallel beta-helix repeat-containing protein [Planctomycetota bacterium]
MSSLSRLSLSGAVLLLAAAPLRADTLKVPVQFDTIQAAVDAAVAGDVVQVSKGIYDENVVVSTAGITLKGKGATINGRILGNCLAINANDVTVESLTLINGAGEPLPDGGTTGGVHAVGTGITLSKLTVHDFGTFGILLEGTGTVTGCKVDTGHGDGIDVVTGDIVSDPVTVISKNKVSRCATGIFASGGVFLVEKNTIDVCKEVGMEVQVPAATRGPPAFTQTTISKNTIRLCLSVGLLVEQELQKSQGVLVEKNTLELNATGCHLVGFAITFDSNALQDNVLDGIDLEGSNCTLTKNKVKDSGLLGIIVSSAGATDGGSAPTGANTLDQNAVQGNAGDGVAVISSGNTITGSTIKDNGGDGIEVWLNADDNQLTDNKVTGSGHEGIDNSGLNTTIADNTCKDSGGADLAGAGDGTGTVNLADSTGNTVSDDSDISTYTTTGLLDLTL